MWPNCIRNWRRCQNQRKATRARSSCLRMDSLENRLVPAVSAYFDPMVGCLQVTIDEDASTGQNVRIAAAAGWSRIYSDQALVPITTPSGTAKIPARLIRSIEINGSSLDNGINLSGVWARPFARLDGPIEIRSGAGSDTVTGSQLDDRIWGQDGDDVLSGLGGNDWLNGGSGKDTINGEDGDDFIDSNDGEPDILDGGQGENVDLSDSLDNLSNFLPHGLRGEYFADSAFDQLGTTRTDPTINFNWGQAQPPYTGDPMPTLWTDNLNQSWYVHYTVRWLGRVVPKFSETYTFHLTVDDGAMLWVNDRLIISAWKDQGPTAYTGEIDLTAGEPANIKLLYYNSWFGATVKLRWSSTSQNEEFIPTSQLLRPLASHHRPARCCHHWPVASRPTRSCCPMR